VILVTGATGRVGRHVVGQLLQAHEEVRPVSRNPERAALPAGTAAVRGDLAEPGSLRTALLGVDRVFIFPAAAPLDRFLELARDAGVRSVVLLSSAAAADEEPNAIGRMHLVHERAVAASGLPWTFVRPNAFMANDLMWAPTVTAEGVVRAPYGQAATAPVDERDIAAVAVRALRDDGHAGEAYELTGPESLTVTDRVEILGHVLGRPLRFEELDPAQARHLMSAHLPAPVVNAVLGMLASRVGASAPVSPSVEQVTGRSPHTYADWVAHNAAAWA
jgi:uncharacterized protein YbjT (DUF2867 family)